MRVCVCVRERVCVCEGVRVYMYRCVGMCGSHGYCKAYKRKLWLGEATFECFSSVLCWKSKHTEYGCCTEMWFDTGGSLSLGWVHQCVCFPVLAVLLRGLYQALWLVLPN